ncbi:MAG TPA: pyrroloquinoline quinone biosynthesis peptide chaperone PqqD [Terriglobales bacterium]|nr:pyrroloquinoline quinone biosynthesis peptide chaperone PqqD [Terriglobales bacterium]
MAGPQDSSKPRLAAGCRWGGAETHRVVLLPEGAIRMQGTGQRILELCDGERTFAEVVAQLQQEYSQADALVIRADASRFLEQLQEKRIVDF